MRISSQEISVVFQDALRKTMNAQEDTAVVFYDLDHIQSRIDALREAFPEESNHAIAIKANPIFRVLTDILVPSGAGAEVATLGELELALQAGFDPSKIVFDSPVKTVSEIDIALQKGVHLNIDNFQEMERVAKRLEERPTRGSIGLRINPQVGKGKISDTSVADRYSKFGVPIEKREEIIRAYLRYPWLTGVHLHVGSQGCSIEMLTEGVSRVYRLANEIERVSPGQIKIFDIGGGVPVSYHEKDDVFSIQEYVCLIKSSCPELLDGRYRIVTEFGRYVHANSGWAVSSVEYVKEDPELSTAMVHLGADFLLRKCLQPHHWHFDISVMDEKGALKQGAKRAYNIAGPLCFAGDIIAEQVLLPRIEQNDYVVIHDVGAYTLGIWSRYNSRQIPKVVGYRKEANDCAFSILKRRETLEDVVGFWK